jgi:hypothetical protein
MSKIQAVCLFDLEPFILQEVNHRLAQVNFILYD